MERHGGPVHKRSILNIAAPRCGLDLRQPLTGCDREDRFGKIATDQAITTGDAQHAKRAPPATIHDKHDSAEPVLD